ncbi:MAG: hypothetical protein AMXMBFR12_09470 [Candidatus Babeliales bacterium]
MIPSSFKSLLLVCLISFLAFPMEQSPSDVVYKKPQGTIPTSASMAFPPKKDNAQQSPGSLRGSLIKGIKRTASLLAIGRRSSSGEVLEPEASSVPTAAQPAISVPLSAAVLKSATSCVSDKLEKKGLIFGKPIYILKHNEQDYTVKVEKICTTEYNVQALKDFKKESAVLRREEILLFIDKHFKALLPSNIIIHDHMEHKAREQAAKKIARIIEKNKNIPFFDQPFYLVSFEKGGYRACAFEWELQEIK